MSTDQDGFQASLSRRERQIMDILYSSGPSSAAEVRAAMPDAPSYSAVRAMLRVLEDKGHIEHRQDGPRYLYRPLVAADQASRSALQHVLRTFFGGSREAVMAALLENEAEPISAPEYERLSQLVQLARQKEEA